LIVKLPSIPIDEASGIIHETGRRRKMILGTKRFVVQRVKGVSRHFSG